MNTLVRSILILVLVLLTGCAALFDTFVGTEDPEAVSSSEEIIMSANADVEFVRAVQTGETTWTFHVTVRHPDTGWEDYADGWDVVLPDGTVVNPDPSNPFTRSQSNISIPADVTEVTVRAHDRVDGFGGREVVVDLATESGADFSVERR